MSETGEYGTHMRTMPNTTCRHPDDRCAPSHLTLPPDGLSDEVFELLSTHGDVLEPLASQDDLTSGKKKEGQDEDGRMVRSGDNATREKTPFTLHNTSHHTEKEIESEKNMGL